MVGAPGLSRFLEEAAEAELQRRQRVEAFDALMRLHSGETISEWETAESTDEWVRHMRAAWERRSSGHPA